MLHSFWASSDMRTVQAQHTKLKTGTSEAPVSKARRTKPVRFFRYTTSLALSQYSASVAASTHQKAIDECTGLTSTGHKRETLAALQHSMRTVACGINDTCTTELRCDTPAYEPPARSRSRYSGV